MYESNKQNKLSIQNLITHFILNSLLFASIWSSYPFCAGDDEAAKMFVLVNEAFQVLSDEDKRQIYDIDGHEGLEEDQKRQQVLFCLKTNCEKCISGVQRRSIYHLNCSKLSVCFASM